MKRFRILMGIDGVSYDKMAQELDYSRPAVWVALNEKKKPGKRLIKAIERFFGEPWDSLVREVKRGDTI